MILQPSLSYYSSGTATVMYDLIPTINPNSIALKFAILFLIKFWMLWSLIPEVGCCLYQNRNMSGFGSKLYAFALSYLTLILSSFSPYFNFSALWNKSFPKTFPTNYIFLQFHLTHSQYRTTWITTVHPNYPWKGHQSPACFLIQGCLFSIVCAVSCWII